MNEHFIAIESSQGDVGFTPVIKYNSFDYAPTDYKVEFV
jgi:hypothetical protein